MVSSSACVVQLIILYMHCHASVGYVIYCDCLEVFGVSLVIFLTPINII